MLAEVRKDGLIEKYQDFAKRALDTRKQGKSKVEEIEAQMAEIGANLDRKTSQLEKLRILVDEEDRKELVESERRLAALTNNNDSTSPLNDQFESAE